MTVSTPTADRVANFFDDYYRDHHSNVAAQRWRRLLAESNASRIVRLLTTEGIRSNRIVEVGCGDGALLAELSRRGFGDSYVAYEISASVVDFVQRRAIPRVEGAFLFDGLEIPEDDGSFDVAILSHVVEHAADPLQLIRETARLAPFVVVQMILSDTLLARRRAHKEAVGSTGHINEYTLATARDLIVAGGLRSLREDILSATPVEHQTYWSRTTRTRAKAYVSAAAGRVAPAISRRLFTGDLATLATHAR